MTTYLVTGASGKLGSQIIRHLPGATGMVRHHDSAPPLRYGDYDNPDSLARAFQDVDRLVLVSSPESDPAVRLRQHATAIDAAVAAGVCHITYTSAFGAQHGGDHLETERLLEATGMNVAILRNGLYTEAFVERALDELPSGSITSGAGPARIATASRDDLAEAAAGASADGATGVFELRGPAWNYDELAQLLGVAHVDTERADSFAPLFRLARGGAFAQEAEGLASLLGREPETIGDVVRRLRRDKQS